MKNLRLFRINPGGKKALFLGLLLLGLISQPLSAHAMTQVKIAVFNFVTLNMEASGYGTTVTNMLGDVFKVKPLYAVMDRKDLEAFLSMSDCQQDDKAENAINVGTSLSLNAVIVGNVEKKGTVIIVNCRVVSVEQKKVIFNTRIGGQGDSGLASEIKKLAGLIDDAVSKHILNATDNQLKPPVNMTNRPGDRQIYLSWEDPPDVKADGYDIFSSKTAEGPFAKVGQVHQREFLDKDLERNATYFYKIKAFTNSGLQSSFTDVISGVTTLTPNPPVILKAESRVRGVQLTWAPSPIPSDDPLGSRGYKLYRAAKEQGPFREVADLKGIDLGVAADAPIDKVLKVTYADKNFRDGERAYYRLTVYNEKKMESGFSSTVKGEAIPVISGFSVQGNLVREIRLVWNAINSPYLSGYNIYRNTRQEGNYTRIKKLASSGETEAKVQYADRDGLGDNLRYYYRVTAYDDMDQQTAATSVLSAVTKPKPVKPSGLRGESLKVKTVPLSWQANPEKDIVAYHVYRQEGPNGRFSNVATVRGVDTGYQDKGLKDGVSYDYKIQAEDKDALLSDFSDIVRVTTKSVPKSPEGLAGDYRNGSVELTWKPGSEPDIAYYKVYEKSFWKADVVAGMDRITSTSASLKTVIDKGKKKTYLVTAVNKDGLESSYSPEIIITGQ